MNHLEDVYFQCSKLGATSQVAESSIVFLVFEFKGRGDLVRLKMVKSTTLFGLLDACLNFAGQFEHRASMEDKIIQLLHYRNKSAQPKALRYVEGKDASAI